MDKQEIIAALNKILEQEHACAIRYATHAAVINGPYSETVAARLKEISNDEVLHAEKLRERITALGGKPSMQVCKKDLTYADKLEEILAVNIQEEKDAINAYSRILLSINVENAILFQTVQEILRDEQEHLEELESLQPDNQ